jgi:cytoskeletal protein CcmA (bactofilin family)
MRLLDSAILNDEGITLRAIATKDGGTIEGKIESFSEGQARVRKKTDLKVLVYCCKEPKDCQGDLLRLSLMDPMSYPMLSCYTKSATNSIV